MIDENYESLLKRFRALAELDLKNEQVQQIHLNIQLAPEKALSLPSGAVEDFGECCRVFACGDGR